MHEVVLFKFRFISSELIGFLGINVTEIIILFSIVNSAPVFFSLPLTYILCVSPQLVFDGPLLQLRSYIIFSPSNMFTALPRLKLFRGRYSWLASTLRASNWFCCVSLEICACIFRVEGISWL